MRLLKTSFWTILLMLSCLSVGVLADDDIPEVTQRVVRVSVVQGEAQIRRAAAGDVDSDDWERVVSNLPLVEGDEITTSDNTRLEIQFDRNTYLRLGANSYLKIVNLRDEGVAISLPQGVLSLNLLRFNKDDGYFEIDAPSTTIAAQKAGTYRVDAGDSRSEEVAVTVTNGGQVRLYSANSGFTLRDGRMAKITISGEYAGEWDMQSAPRFADNFEEWVLERNDVVASRLQKAKYGEYYDDHFYGAEDLNSNGEWIYTSDYGYIWRPYNNVTSVYDNWSPYRYGQWRMLPYYGWTWVNDEPWGWATYHHGRWIYYNGYWAWTPYSSRRGSRSYWRPALVVFTTWGNNYCWYPLPYSYGYYDYNYYYNRRKTVIINNTTIINNYPSPTPTPMATGPTFTPKVPSNIPIGQLPPGAVVTVAEDRFGTRGSQGFGTVSEDIAKQIITKTPERLDTPPKLPTRTELDDKITKEVRVSQPTVAVKVDRERIKVGATTRPDDAPVDRTLREKQIFGDRQPVVRQPQSDKKEIDAGIGISPTTRNTGAVTREPKSDEDNSNTTRTPRNTGGNSFPTNSGGSKNDDENETRRTPRQPTFNPQPPRQSPPPVKQPEPPRQEPPPSRQPSRQPSFDPPPRQEPPRSSPPPQQADPPKSSPPPPAKSEPAPEQKTPPSLAPSKNEKDG